MGVTVSDEPTLQERFEAALAELKPQHRKFVHEYLHDFHQRNAAIRAGYSERSADSTASDLLRNPKIRAAVDLGFQLAAMPAPEVIARLSEEARGDMGDFLRVDEENVTLTWSLLAVPTGEDGEIDLAGTTMRLAIQSNVQPTDRILHTATIKRAVARLDLLEAGLRGKLGLIKKYTVDDKGKESIELYSAHDARIKLGELYKLFGSKNINVNLTPEQAAQMTDEELDAELKRRGLL